MPAVRNARADRRKLIAYNAPMANGKHKLALTWIFADVRQKPCSIKIGNGTDGQDVQKMVHS